MKEANSPVDIGKDQIKQYKKDTINTLTNFSYGSSRYNIPGLIQSIDLEDPEIMSELERQTYVTMREGIQIFRALNRELDKKIGLSERIASVPQEKMLTDPELLKLQDFANNFSAYAASTYISKKVDNLIQMLEPDVDTTKDQPDLSNLKINGAAPYFNVVNQLLAPVVSGLIAQNKDEKREFFKTATDFPAYVKDVFAKYAEIAKAGKDKYADLQQHIDGYTFRIMDDFVTLQGYEDKSIARMSVKDKSAKTFEPIDPESIVGNDLAKGKIYRYAQRMVLYDPVKQMNPIMDLGGLAWSAVMDGPPGTGKTSMLRMFMTLLDQYATQLGLDYQIIMINQDIKDEFYGKTGKILREKLMPTRDPTKICGVLFEDIDLLTSKRSDAQGADNDINNIIMQYLDGAETPKTKGKIINFASTNKATGLDDAMRNRFFDRMYVDGPVDPFDFADIGHAALKKMMKQGLATIDLGKDSVSGKAYVPLATQKVIISATEADVKKYLKNRENSVAAEFQKKFSKATIMDFGQYMAEAKKQNNGITGRSMNAIMEAIKERSADFDIPSEWLADRARFVDQPWEKKVNMLKELYTPVTPAMLFEEAQRYIDSEARYAKKDAEDAIARGHNDIVSSMQAKIKFIKEELEKGPTAYTSELTQLQTTLQMYQEKIAERATAGFNAEFDKQSNEKEEVNRIINKHQVNTMNKQLYKAGILGNDLFKVEGDLVDNYNASLEQILGKKTALTEFSIDKRGLSPEIQAELGDSYLQNGNANRYVIVLSPEQKTASLVREEFSFDNAVIDSLFDKNQSGINIVTRSDSLYAKMDDGLGTYNTLEDVMMLNNVTLDLKTPSGFVDKVAELNTLIADLQKNPELLIKNDAEHVKKLHELAVKIGDVRKYKIDEMGLSQDIGTFYSNLFDGVYVFREDIMPVKKSSSKKGRSRDSYSFQYSSAYDRDRESEMDSTPTTIIYTKVDGFKPDSGPNVKFIPVHKEQDVIDFLLGKDLVAYSEEKVPTLLRRIEDLEMLKQGYNLSKLSPAERERALDATVRSPEWDLVRSIQKALGKGYNLSEDIFHKSVPGTVKASLLQVKTKDPTITKVVSSLLTNITISDFEEMYRWNRPNLEKTFEESTKEVKQYIIDTLKS